MAAVLQAPERRRARPGSLERPVNGRLYRGTWLLVGLPLLVLAFSVAQPAALRSPNLPSAFDPAAAVALDTELSQSFPSRQAGSAGARGAASWFAQQLGPYGYIVRSEHFTVTLPGHGRVRLTNLLATTPGLSQKTIVVMAHRDDAGAGPGADDNASGTAALLELARAYAPGATAARLKLPYSLLFLSTDGGAEGGAGAAWFAQHAPERQSVIAVLNLDAIAGAGPARIELNGDSPRSPAPGLVETIRAALVTQTGAEPTRPSALRQLVDLGFPFSLYEQAPFVTRGIPAVTVTTAGDRPLSASPGAPERVSTGRLAEIGRAAQNSLDAMEQGIALAPGPSSYLYLGTRIVRGWAVELVLIGALLPFLAAAVDLFARCRRRRIRISPALRSYRSRLAFWLWTAALFGLFSWLGLWRGGGARPPSPASVRWPAAGLFALGVLAGLGWIVARDRLLPRREVRAEEELAGHTAALLVLAVVALLVVATNPFALVFVLPSLHLWLWLPQVSRRPFVIRAAVLAAGFAGPGLLLWSFASRYGLGLDAPWYVAWLFALGYAPLPAFLIALGWTAAAAQLAALAGGRYAPYPSAAERPPRGPIRRLVRQVVLTRRRHARTAAGSRRRALSG